MVTMKIYRLTICYLLLFKLIYVFSENFVPTKLQVKRRTDGHNENLEVKLIIIYIII